MLILLIATPAVYPRLVLNHFSSAQGCPREKKSKNYIKILGSKK